MDRRDRARARAGGRVRYRLGGRYLGLSASDRRALSLSCLAVAAVLAVAFVVVNGFGGVSVSELESP